MLDKYRGVGIDCRYDPDTDLNSLGRCEDPDHPSTASKRRHRRLLDMLLLGYDQSLSDVRKILLAYPYLRAEYGPKLDARAAEIREQKEAEIKKHERLERYRYRCDAA